VKEGDERAASGQRYRGLAGGVAAAYDRDALAGAQLGFWRAGGVEDRQAFELGQPVDWEPAVLGSCCKYDGAGSDLAVVFEPDDVAAVAWFE
jgi:hypothetical protein